MLTLHIVLMFSFPITYPHHLVMGITVIIIVMMLLIINIMLIILVIMIIISALYT